MQVNLLANPEYYRTDYRELNDEEDVISIVKQFLKSNVNGENEHFVKIFQDLERDRNNEIRFDSSDEQISLYGNTGNRVAYGAFRHSALVHSTQTVWTYTFQIIKTDDGLYLSADSWGWLQKSNLSKRVSTHLE
jgi:hypothetical protein